MIEKQNDDEPVVALEPIPSQSSAKDDAIPWAHVTERPESRRWFASRLWILTVICGLISAGLFFYSRKSTGDVITIEFQQGHGLKPEDRLSFRGIEIGSVEKIELDNDRLSVIAHVRLAPEARALASEGAKFWIVRPFVSLDSVQGLDTLIGAKYIAIQPSSSKKLQSHFVGMDAPPIVAPPEGALEILLDGNTRGGLENGAPILFRGFRVGNVIQVGLASDARSVQARCAIDPEYRDIVRKNSRFWNRSGWSIELGLTGIKLDADSFAQIFKGGIEMATPTDPAAGVSTGHRFVLHEKPEPEWLNWKPSLAHGKAWSGLNSKLPQPTRIAMRWQERTFGFRHNLQRTAWCLPLTDGTCLSIYEQIVAPKSALTDSVHLEMAGVSVKPGQIVAQDKQTANAESSSVARFSVTEVIPSDVPRWPADRVAMKLPESVCDVVVAHADASSSIAIDAARLKPAKTGWDIDDSVVLDPDWNGLPVISAQSNLVIGLLSIGKEKRCIVNN